MKWLGLVLIVASAGCAGGPVAMDAEVEYELAVNSAADQDFAVKADAEQMAVVGPMLAALQRALVWLGENATPMPPEILEPLQASLAALEEYTPLPAVEAPDPSEKPSTGFGLGEILAWAAGAGVAQSLVRRILREVIGFDPLEPLAGAVTFKKTRERHAAARSTEGSP